MPTTEEAPPAEPLPAEPLTIDELEAYALTLSEEHKGALAGKDSVALLSQLARSARRLERVHEVLSAAQREDESFGSEEWLRDNFYVVQDQVREIRQHLPRQYYLELPALTSGPQKGYPRTYLLARGLIEHTEGRIDAETLARFVAAYQQALSLTIGEVWAVPIMLRCALVEQLDQLADQVLIARRERDRARAWLPRLVRGDEPASHGFTLSPTFVVELLLRLRDQPPSLPAWDWLTSRLQHHGQEAGEIVQFENKREAARQMVIGNVIRSMRFLSSLDWPTFFERVSVVERILREDPAEAYAHMDFATRDRYRRSVEQLSKRSEHDEVFVATQAIRCAADARESQPDGPRRHHVGYYLISRGRYVLEQQLGYRPLKRERLARFAFRHPAIGYLGAIAVFLALVLAGLLYYARLHGFSPLALLILSVAALVPVSELAVNLVNRLMTRIVAPRPLPKLGLKEGIPSASRTIVVVPTLLTSEPRIQELIAQLEVRFIANRDANLHFALLGDFSDAASETQPTDAALVESAVEGISALNAQYGPDRFLFFQRGRRWNEAEQCWMGWERKRGKLVEFNRLLQGATDTSFVVQVGDRSLLSSVTYVITLDSDTELPIDAARKLVGAISHPLNRPRFDPQLRQVTEGYGILQPRIDINAASASCTLFARSFAGQVGLDPYATASSDVYQDLFHEGSYVGKGIYDVAAFEASLANCVPPNALLSHDLFEGFYARTGLCADICLIDDYPPHYLVWAARLHRWVRGDWQIARCLWRTVPDASGRPVVNTLSAINRWKIADNLRRSLLPPALVLTLIGSWTIFPGSPLVWTLLVVLALAFPAYMKLGQSIGSRARGVSLRQHLKAERADLAFSGRQVLLSAAFLAHQAHMMLDAISRTLVRMLITRRHLLQWESAADAAQRLRTHRVAHLTGMWSSPALAAALFLVLPIVHPDRFWWSVPFLALWTIAPELAYRTGLPLANDAQPLSAADEITLRKLARRTWRFFEELVGAIDHWLVPDNFQEDRPNPVASRTSPTNLGLQLLSEVAAHDCGYITSSDLIARLERTFDTLEQLERYRGHFLNWYDTRTLAPLVPLYVSTVDSGNLAAYLLTLKEALSEIVRSAPIIGERFLQGLNDTAAVAEEEIERFSSALGRRPKAAHRMLHEVAVFRHRLQSCPRSFSGWLWVLQEAADRIGILQLLLHEAEEALPDRAPFESNLAQIRFWFGRIWTMLGDQRKELSALASWIGLTAEPATIPSITGLVAWCESVDAALKDAPGDVIELRSALARSRGAAADFLQRTEQLRSAADRFVDAMNFGFLFDPERQLFSIGYNVTDGRLDSSYYDMLASEARLASFVAIATGKVPAEHWFRLARSMTGVGDGRALLSWSGSMFEYFMPLLVMRSLPHTLMDETYRSVVDRQIDYGADRGVPWGCSESAYAAQDLDLNYQYKAFGAPGLGLKRGLANDLVIAPYACVLTAPIRAADVAKNLRALERQGAGGRFGLYDAVDYTTHDQSAKADKIVVRTFMAHHQGMTIVALDNTLHGNPMPARFHREPRVQAVELLLQERMPRLVPLKPVPEEPVPEVHTLRAATFSPDRRYTTPHTQSPRAHLLSNGSYTVVVSNAGGGYSERRGIAMTRWREDITRDHWGSFIYIRDLHSGRFWSAGYQPTCEEPEDYQVTFSGDRAVFHRRDDGIEVHTEIAISPEDDAEIRRVSLTNHGRRSRYLEVTSYAEVVLAPPEADLAHPAFSNLFVQSAAVPECRGLICTRRPREGQTRLSLWHVLAANSPAGHATEYETDRARFLGRTRDPRRPEALTSGTPLSNTVGAVLDPIVSLREKLWLPPGVTARLSFTTGFADSEEAARVFITKYHDRHTIGRALALALTHSSIELRNLNVTAEDAQTFQRLASRLRYSDPRLIDGDAVRSNQRPVRDLWKYGISGDRPILLARIGEAHELALVKDLLKAHEYCHLKGFLFDLVVLNEHAASYQQDLQEQIEHLARARPSAAWLDQPGGVFLRRAAIMSPDDRILLRAVARAVLVGTGGSLRQQLNTTLVPFPVPTAFVPKRALLPMPVAASVQNLASDPPRPARPKNLLFFNGIGGFTEDGREYVIHLPKGRTTPAPWSNVVANPRFGFLATESSPGYTWSENSHENRLTPWSNDPVSDPPGEVLFLRDEGTGRYWSTTPLPAPGEQPYVVRHGQGYTTYEHTTDGWRADLTLFVPPDDSLKIWRLRLTNQFPVRRQCSATLFVEWTLGETRQRSAQHVVTWLDQDSQALFARNRQRDFFGSRVAFLDVNRTTRRFSANRSTFLGRNGRLSHPAALERAFLAGPTGATLDPCGSLQVMVELDPGQTEEIVFLLGEGHDENHARELVARYRRPETVEAAFTDMQRHWDAILGAARIRTPEPALDMVLNRWLLYQTLSCRMWGRSGFYQSSGAFGFRDQLQDCLALTLSAPQLTREHILRAAGRQFVEGDVQHWWHEPGGQGIRTRCSDDRLWLPFAVLEYVKATGDWSILDEQVSLLEGRAVRAEDDAYERPGRSESTASIYEHCVKAVDRSLDVGAHGLPLIGAGDWNDGFNLVGHGGKGESVWLGWFLVPILKELADVAASRGDEQRHRGYGEHAERLRFALDQAWDGDWYRRAYFDDGTPLGSKLNEECSIDSIAQSWAVLSGAADANRARTAMEAAQRELVRSTDRLILLLTPPFDRMTPDPGYIRGYVPGVRENGGQYSHAALWTVLAFLRLGDGDRAATLCSLINPVDHARTAEQAARYKLEPYVIAGDVYSLSPHAGRGGWSWYTGAAGWMYRVGVEALLGISLRGGKLHIDPCIPRAWTNYEVLLTRPDAEYLITVDNPEGVNRGVIRLEVDGEEISHSDISLAADRRRHTVNVLLGTTATNLGHDSPSMSER